MGDVIKFLVMLVFFFITERIIHNIHKSKINENETDTNYIITFPKAFVYVFSMICIAGIVLFIIFFAIKMSGNETVTEGHLWFAMIFSAIGALGVLVEAKWKVAVNGEEMQIEKLFKGKQKIAINEIEKAVIERQKMSEEMGEKERVIVYKNGKKLIAIEDSTLNYSRFINTLKSYGKLN